MMLTLPVPVEDVVMRLVRSVPALAFVLLFPPAILAADPVKIGDRVGKLRFTDIRSLPRTLDDFGAKKAFVLVFTNTSCPVAQRYFPTLRALEKEYRGKDVQFVAVNSAAEDTLIATATHAVKFDVEFPVVKDFDASVARAVGATRTPEAVVLDGEKRLVYRGRIDDEILLRGRRDKPTATELKDAIEAVLAGKKVATPETEVDGCAITFPKERKPKDVTFAEHVAPILAKHCWDCHKAGGSAPFALTTYKQASSRADAILEVITDQRMPPWFASHDFGPFVNRRGLTDAERDTIADWVKSGTEPGDLAKVPPAPEPPKSKWQIGTPDLVLNSIEFELPATGDIPYKYTLLLHTFQEDTWIQNAEIISDNPRALHHCNMAFASLVGGFKDENFITGAVPGGEAMNLDPGVAFRIPKGSVLGLQMHFVATGKPEKCKVSVGLRYPREVVQKQLRHYQIHERGFAIPPGAPAHKVTATAILHHDIVGVGMFAHMHLRGKDMTFQAHLPEGKTETLLVIPNYNFAWQIPYRWEPGKKTLPKGTRLECVAHFDNSAFNPYNPNPKATVRNGPQTHHEMMYGFFFYTHAHEKLNLKVDPKTGAEKKQIDPKTIEAYEKLGAIYGGWVKDSDGWEFKRGEKAAANGLPGFYFAGAPKAELPHVAVPFGLYLAHAEGVDNAFLKRLSHLNNLKTLDLAWTPITEVGLKELAPLSNRLATLGLTRTNYRYRQSPGAKITDKSLGVLREIGLLHAIHAAEGKDGARPSSLEEVNSLVLTMTEVTDSGLKELVAFRNLTRLYLDHTDLTDAGLKELAALKNLNVLHLQATSVTDAGLKQLTALKNLCQLNLQYTEVTDAGIAELKKALPNCKIER